MNHEPLIPVSAGCEACQRQLSEIADVGGTLAPQLQIHFDGCEVCAQFAERWLAGSPAVLARQVSAPPDDRLRKRILGAAASVNVIPFPTAMPRSLSRTVWLGRIAACLAVAGFSYWLLNPTVSPVSTRPTGPTLTQSLLKMEDRTKREQQTLQAAIVDGSRQVQGDVAWSMSALEL